jgi:hypothetical protein
MTKPNGGVSRGQMQTIITDKDKVQERIRTIHRKRRNGKELNMHPAGALQYKHVFVRT